MNPLQQIPERFRGWVYLVAFVFQAALLAGLVAGDGAERWAAFVSLVVGTGTSGLAASNTARRKPKT